MENYFSNLVLSRQSCREFNDKPLDSEVAYKIAEQSALAPSACNSQPWKMYVVTNPESLSKTAEALGVNGHNKFLNKGDKIAVVFFFELVEEFLLLLCRHILGL